MNLYTVAWHDVDGFWMPCFDKNGQILASESIQEAEKLMVSHTEYLTETLAGKRVKVLVPVRKMFEPKYREEVHFTWTGKVAEVRRRELRTLSIKRAKLAL